MWVIFAALLFSGSVSAMTDAEVKADFIKTAMSCMNEHPVEMADLVKLKALVLPDNRDVKCLLACSYRKYGTLNAEGKFDIDAMYKVAEKSKEGDEAAIINAKKLADVCFKVNEKAVSDGNAGCERSGFMFTCVVDTAPKFGFTV